MSVITVLVGGVDTITGRVALGEFVFRLIRDFHFDGLAPMGHDSPDWNQCEI